jgi:hypothetical protein
MNVIDFNIRGCAGRSVVFLLGLTLPLAATLIAGVRLKEAADILRQERSSLIEQQTALDTELQAGSERLHSIESEETRLRDNLSARVSSPDQRRLIERGWHLLQSPSSKPTAVPVSGATGLLVQSKAGKIYFPGLLSDEAYSKAAAAVEGLQMQIDYGHLFAELKLTSDGRERLAQLLTERELAKQDILGLDTEAGQSEVMKHRVAVARDWRTRLKDEFGPEIVQQIGAYDGTLRLRTAVDALEIRVSHTETPLTPVQSERLYAALVAALGTKVGTRYWSVPDQVIGQMQTVLSPAQLASLKQIQEEQLGIIEARDARAAEALNPENDRP